MAAFTDLLHRLEQTLHREHGLHVECIYRAQPLPGWLATPWSDTKHNAAPENLRPVLLVNVKGTKADDTLCIMRLADLETLVRADVAGLLGTATAQQHQRAHSAWREGK